MSGLTVTGPGHHYLLSPAHSIDGGLEDTVVKPFKMARFYGDSFLSLWEV